MLMDKDAKMVHTQHVLAYGTFLCVSPKATFFYSENYSSADKFSKDFDFACVEICTSKKFSQNSYKTLGNLSTVYFD